MARIAIVTTSYPHHPDDAAGHFVLAEAEQLVAQGHQVVVLSPGPGADQVGNPQVVRLVGGSAFGWPGALTKLRQQPLRILPATAFVIAATHRLRTGRFEKIIAHWLLPCAWPIACAVDAPLEVVAHGSDVRLLLSLPPIVRRMIVGALQKRRTTFRFVAKALLEELVAATDSRLRQRSTVAPSPIHMPRDLTRFAARTTLGVDQSERLIVVVGRLIATKRLDVALSAALLVACARTVVIGEGPEHLQLEDRFPEAEFRGHLTRTETLAWLVAADLLISASRHEGAPTVVREARALGVDVVAVNSADLQAWAEQDAGIHLI